MQATQLLLIWKKCKLGQTGILFCSGAAVALSKFHHQRPIDCQYSLGPEALLLLL